MEIELGLFGLIVFVSIFMLFGIGIYELIKNILSMLKELKGGSDE